MGEAIAFVSRIVATVLAALGMMCLGEWARFGFLSSKGEPMSFGWSAGLVCTIFLLSFLLAFGGAKQ